MASLRVSGPGFVRYCLRDCERGRMGGWLRASALAVIGAVVSMAGAGGGDCDLESARRAGTVQNLKDRRFDLYSVRWRNRQD